MANDGSTPPKAIPVNSQTQSQSGNKTLNQLGKIGVNAATGAGRNVVSSLASGNTSNLGSSAINGAISGATGSGGINVSNLFGGGGSGGSGFSLGGSGGAAAGGNFASSAGSSVGSAVGSALGGSTGSAIGGILGGFVQGILSLLGGIGSIIMIVIQLISSLFSGGSGGGSSGGSGGQNGLQQAVGSLGSNVNSLGDAAGQILGGAGDLLGLNTRPEQAAFGYGGTNTGQRSNLFGSLSNGNNNLLGGLVKAGLGYAATQSDNPYLQALGTSLLGTGLNDILGSFSGGSSANPNSPGGRAPQSYIATADGLVPVAGNGNVINARDYARTNGWTGGRTQAQVESNLVTIQTGSGAQFRVNRVVAGNFLGFLSDLEKSGYYIDGSQSSGYNWRNKRGGTTMSEHAYGNAIDINWHRNKGFWGGSRDLPREVEKIAANHGLVWGGLWSNNDDMEFQYHARTGIPMRGI